MKKQMNYIKSTLLGMMLVAMSGCDLAGLDFQTNEEYKYHVLEPKINMTAWEYMTQPRPDTLFNLMVRGIRYAGLEEEYKKQGRTFLLLTHTAIFRKNTNGSVNTGSYFGFKTVAGKAALKWSDYPVADVRQFFLYHIIDAPYSYHNLTPDITIANTLLETGDKRIRLLVRNDRDSKIRINDFPTTKRVVQVRTSNIQTTNGVVHVLDGFLEPGEK